MTLSEATKTCFRKYITFSGRATRAEFWKFILFIILGMLICLAINSLIFGPEIGYRVAIDANDSPIGPTSEVRKYTTGVVGNIFGLIVLLPWIAVGWRRMHDIGKPGYLPFVLLIGWSVALLTTVALLMGFSEMIDALHETGVARVENAAAALVFIVAIIAIMILNTYWLAKPSQPGINAYGPNPTEVTT